MPPPSTAGSSRTFTASYGSPVKGFIIVTVCGPPLSMLPPSEDAGPDMSVREYPKERSCVMEDAGTDCTERNICVSIHGCVTGITATRLTLHVPQYTYHTARLHITIDTSTRLQKTPHCTPPCTGLRLSCVHTSLSHLWRCVRTAVRPQLRLILRLCTVVFLSKRVCHLTVMYPRRFASLRVAARAATTRAIRPTTSTDGFSRGAQLGRVSDFVVAAHTTVILATHAVASTTAPTSTPATVIAPAAVITVTATH